MGCTEPKGVTDIHAYLAEFDDIPGTRVFTAKRARQGYQLNQFAMSLMKAENRERWKADEAAYLEGWGLTEDQKAAVLARDYNRLLDLGGNSYCLAPAVCPTALLSSVSGLLGSPPSIVLPLGWAGLGVGGGDR